MAAAKKEVTGSTFEQMLTRSNSKITADRAKRLAKSAKREYDRMVVEKEEKIDLIDDKIERMMDLSASNQTTTDNRTKDLDTARWVRDIAELEMDKELTRINLEVIQEKVGKFFN